MTVVSIHQPNYLPWLGFFNKILSCDIFVFLDDVQYPKNGPVNRNKIRTKTDIQMLTVPVNLQFGNKIFDVKIDNSSGWSKKHKRAINLNYSKSQFYNQYWKDLEEIYDKKFDRLIDLNVTLINFLMKRFEIPTKIVFSSNLAIDHKGSDKILGICKSLNAGIYVSGPSGKNYLNLDDFQKENIKVKFQNFQHPIYNQIYSPFISNISAIDLLFNEGVNSKRILQN